MSAITSAKIRGRAPGAIGYFRRMARIRWSTRRFGDGEVGWPPEPDVAELHRSLAGYAPTPLLELPFARGVQRQTEVVGVRAGRHQLGVERVVGFPRKHLLTFRAHPTIVSRAHVHRREDLLESIVAGCHAALHP